MGDGASLEGNTHQNLSSPGLNTGAKVGLGIGIPLGVIGFAVVEALIWLRRRQQSGPNKYGPETFVPT